MWWPLELETINGRNISSKVALEPTPTKQIVVLLFDDKTQFLLRQNGMPIKDFERKGRDLIRLIIEKLEKSNVKSIGINLNLSSPSGNLADENLAKTIAKFKNIVIADSINSPLPHIASTILKKASGIGYGELFADYDKTVHKIKLIDKSFGDIQAFSYALFKISTRKDVDQTLKAKNEFYLRYLVKFFVKYSLIDFAQGKISPLLLKDKIIILGIGSKSKLTRDQLYSPFDKNTLLSDSEVQAIALSNLLYNLYLHKFSLIEYPILFIALSLFLGLLFSNLPTTKRVFLGVLLFVSIIIFSQISYTHYKLVIELIPLLFLVLGNLIIGSLIFLQINLQEQNIELEEALIMLSNRVKELKEVRKQLSTKSEDERRRIARELHDDSLARITDLRRYLESMLLQDLPINMKKELGVSINTLDNVTSEIRRTINALRPSMLDNAMGLIPAIENLLDELSRRSNHKIQTKLATSISKLKLIEANEIHLYRIIQEALNNVFKHSHATKVEVSIKEQPGQILILIRDNGIGFNLSGLNKKPKSGFGLVDMKERADLIGANIQYLTNPSGVGTAFEITLAQEKIKVTEKNKEEVLSVR